MNEREFCYWLQGFFEIEEAASFTPEKKSGLDNHQVRTIKDHLKLVMTKVTPWSGGGSGGGSAHLTCSSGAEEQYQRIEPYNVSCSVEPSLLPQPLSFAPFHQINQGRYCGY